VTDNGFADYSPQQKPEYAALTGRIQVTAARPHDIDAILEVEAKADRTSAEIGTMAAAINDEKQLVVVAFLEGGIVGWGKTHFWSYADGPAPVGHYLGGVTVIPDLRRRGVARALTQARLDWIWNRADTAWYVVNSANNASIDLHRRWGFTEIARAAQFHTTSFTGGVGLLLMAKRPIHD
jgi:aminoglycoside 6'-N-acetyltransferase I